VLKRVHEIEGVLTLAIFRLETINTILVLGVVILGVVVLGVVILASEFVKAILKAELLVNIIMLDPT
jgi:hypothetical protein